MSYYIVGVKCSRLDEFGIESSSIMDTHIPVNANDETEAFKKGVEWLSDGAAAFEDHDLQWRCDDLARGVTFVAHRCLRITEEELDFFLSLTGGASGLVAGGR